MKAKKVITKGIFFALSAAALNASIGTFSKVLMLSGFIPSSIAFIKTLLGFLILCLLVPFLRKSTPQASMYQASLCAFLGIFVLFFFETSAYDTVSAATVVVMLMASANVSALIMSKFVLKEKLTAHVVSGAAIAIAGVIIVFSKHIENSAASKGIFMASVAGTGYGAFSVAMKKMRLSGGLVFTRQLLLFGSIYLLAPASVNGFVVGAFSPLTLACLLGLAVLPTIFGFYCTTKAIEYLAPAQVQTIELTEPIFAGLLAFIFIGENPTSELVLGGSIIILGICVSNNLIMRPTRHTYKLP